MIWTAAVAAMVATMATLAIVVFFVWSVVGRWFGAPFDVHNIVSGLLVTATFAGMAWTTVRGEQVSVQVVTEHVGPKVNRVLDLIIWTLGSGYIVWLLIAAFQKAIDRTWPIPETIIDGVSLAPLWPWRWVFAISMIPFLFIAVLNLVRAIMGRRPYDDVMEVDELVASELGLSFGEDSDSDQRERHERERKRVKKTEAHDTQGGTGR